MINNWYTRNGLPANMDDWTNLHFSQYAEIESKDALNHIFGSINENAIIYNKRLAIRYFIKHIIEKHC